MTLLKGWWLGMLGLALAPLACSDDDKAQATPSDGDAGESAGPTAPESFPPALGPEDCASTVTGLKLSQPAGADVWGGLTLLEFEVEGAKARSFEVQAYDPDTEAWLLGYNGYTGVNYSAQRDDGSYVLGVSVVPSAASQDGEQRLRVRPTQTGCPEAEWTESDTFALVSPFDGTSWQGTIPESHFVGSLFVNDMSLDHQVKVQAGDTTVEATFGDDGSYSQTVTVPLKSAKGELYDGCTFVLAYEGSWRYELDPAGDTPQLQISELTFSSSKGSKCTYPALADMRGLVPDPAAGSQLPNGNYYYPRINYLPTLASTPAAPIWLTDVFDYALQQFQQLLSYSHEGNIADAGAPNLPANGYLEGNLNPQQVTVDKQ